MFVASSAQCARLYNLVRVYNGKAGRLAVVHENLRLYKGRQPGGGLRKSNSLLHASQQQQSTVGDQVADSASDIDTIAAVVTGEACTLINATSAHFATISATMHRPLLLFCNTEALVEPLHRSN